MITVKELFDHAVESDLSHLAHTIFWAISNQKIRLSDNSDRLKGLPLDEEEIKQMKEQNVLGIGRVKLFVIETGTKGWFAFYLAEHSLDAFRLHEERFGEQDVKVTHADRLLIPMMAFAETGKEESLYEYKRKVVAYPAYVGHAKAGERVLYRVRARGAVG